MTDDRGLPEYGEYATPEQQAAAMGRVYVPPEQIAAENAIAEHTMSQVGVARPSGYANRFFTLLLLAIGALTLIERIPTYFSYASSFKGEAQLSGLGAITVPSSVDGAGIPTLIANIVLYAATVLLSILAIRRGRLSFYIPIVGAIVFGLVGVLIISLYAPGLLSQVSALMSETSG
jgi:hypothetical protein